MTSELDALVFTPTAGAPSSIDDDVHAERSEQRRRAPVLDSTTT